MPCRRRGRRLAQTPTRMWLRRRPPAGSARPGRDSGERPLRVGLSWTAAFPSTDGTSSWLAVVAVVAVGVLTSGFGLVGDENGKGHRHGGASPKPTVAILNGTDVPGLAALVDKEVVKAAGYKTGPIDNAGSTVASTVAMFVPGHEADAKRLAKAIQSQLGKTPTQAMTSDISSRAGDAKLALALGVDDSQFGVGSG